MSVGDAPRGLYAGKTIVDRTDIMNYDRIITASDGLFNNIDIEEALAETKGLPVVKALQKLNEMARDGMVHGYGKAGNLGNKDNITIAMYEILPVPLRGKL